MASVFCVACEHDHPVDGSGAVVDRCGSPSCSCTMFFRKRGSHTATVAIKLALSVERHCEHCGEILKRREKPGHRERAEAFLKRRFCNRKCGGRPSTPTVKEQPLPQDQCWAGFLAGRRCVLDRGSHVTHRDEAGHEFVRAERKPVERTSRHVQADSFAEHLSMRGTWRSARRS